MRAALIQLCSTTDIDRNLNASEDLVTKAAQAGTDICVLPEMFAQLGPRNIAELSPEPLGGPICQRMSHLAASLNINLVAGSFPEKLPDTDLCSNTCCVYGRDGQMVACYRKIHLFDCNVPGAVYQESKTIKPGNELVTCQADEKTLGLAICYDLRFPEIFRGLALKGAKFIAMPAAFTEKTGRDHWEILIRARAIENQVFMLACDQAGAPGKGLRRFGRSMIVDPWGIIIAQAPDKECYVTAELDFESLEKTRLLLPSLANRRPQAYYQEKAGTD